VLRAVAAPAGFSAVPRVPIPLVLDAFEAVGICQVANLEPSDLREGAQGPLELSATCRIRHLASRSVLRIFHANAGAQWQRAIAAA
jgi:hypothetical protein